MGTVPYVPDLLHAFSCSQLHLKELLHKVNSTQLPPHSSSPFAEKLIMSVLQCNATQTSDSRGRYLSTLLHDVPMHLLKGAESVMNHVLCS